MARSEDEPVLERGHLALKRFLGEPVDALLAALTGRALTLNSEINSTGCLSILASLGMSCQQAG